MGTNIFLFIGLCLSLGACEEAIEWDLDASDSGLLAVEAIITNEHKTQKIKLSQSFPDLGGSPVPVTDAHVILTDQIETVPFEINGLNPGLYLSTIPFAAQKDVIYTLFIHWKDQNYISHNILSFVSPLEPIRFDFSRSRDSVSIMEVAPQYHPLEQAMHEVDIYWRHIDPSPFSQVRMYFYTFTTIDGSELFKPTEESVFFPSGSVLIRKKYGLNDDFAKYLRGLVLETRLQGGFFDEDPASLPSNISNGGLGFFSVCAVLADTLIVK